MTSLHIEETYLYPSLSVGVLRESKPTPAPAAPTFRIADSLLDLLRLAAPEMHQASGIEPLVLN